MAAELGREALMQVLLHAKKPEDVLAALATFFVPEVATWCEIHLVHGGSSMRSVARPWRFTAGQARVDSLEPLADEEETRLLYVRDMGLIVAGPGLTTCPNAIETPTQRKRRKDRMKGRLELLVRFGMFEVFSEKEWQGAKEV